MIHGANETRQLNCRKPDAAWWAEWLRAPTNTALATTGCACNWAAASVLAISGCARLTPPGRLMKETWKLVGEAGAAGYPIGHHRNIIIQLIHDQRPPNLCATGGRTPPSASETATQNSGTSATAHRLTSALGDYHRISRLEYRHVVLEACNFGSRQVICADDVEATHYNASNRQPVRISDRTYQWSASLIGHLYSISTRCCLAGRRITSTSAIDASHCEPAAEAFDNADAKARPMHPAERCATTSAPVIADAQIITNGAAPPIVLGSRWPRRISFAIPVIFVFVFGFQQR